MWLGKFGGLSYEAKMLPSWSLVFEPLEELLIQGVPIRESQFSPSLDNSFFQHILWGLWVCYEYSD